MEIIKYLKEQEIIPNELWKPCPNFEDKYLVSNFGRILSIGTYNTCKKGLISQHKKKGRNGYMQVRLFDNNRAKTVEVHTLVAKAFIENPHNFPMINHKDEDKTNNCVENLEWCDNKYNKRYSCAKSVDVYSKNGDYVETFDCITDAALRYKTSTSEISKCCKSEYGTRVGFQFRYKGRPFSPKPIKEKKEKEKKEKISHNRNRFKKIDEYSTKGIFIKTWDNITIASKTYNIPTTNISKCCKGIIKTICGHIFLYHNSDIKNRLIELTKRNHISKFESHEQ